MAHYSFTCLCGFRIYIQDLATAHVMSCGELPKYFEPVYLNQTVPPHSAQKFWAWRQAHPLDTPSS